MRPVVVISFFVSFGSGITVAAYLFRVSEHKAISFNRLSSQSSTEVVAIHQHAHLMLVGFLITSDVSIW
jgi:hypothetical protein